MRRETQLELARALQTYAREGSTALAPEIFRNPVAAYGDPERLKLERERLFLRMPLFMTMSCRVREPGDYIAEEIAGVPVLLVRGRDGVVRAFANICRHRGAPVASGCGRTRVFSCPYHGWTYALDGKLAGIPDERSFTGIEKATQGLLPLAAGESHGMIFVRLTSGDALNIDVDAHLSGLGEEFGAYRFDGYSFFGAEVLTPKINWKFGIDTFLESYHLPALHRATVAPLIRGNTGAFDAFGDHSRLTMLRYSANEWDGKADSDWDVLANILPIYRLMPNGIIVFQSDHLETWRMLPGAAPDRCAVEFALYSPEPPATDKARAYWQKNYDLAVRTVKDEDFALGEKMQRAFMSGLQAEVVYGRNEPALIHFHERLRAALAI
ncbi:MAG TPA: SRPBCC family protein [Burkholderiales bacterium]|jgi:phenylpropionate dioxygenase-like ring-hydroxylating dioxygenase large terminal subunit|nr:SRPBCC family protein [Burkholderiales bacterium]